MGETCAVGESGREAVRRRAAHEGIRSAAPSVTAGSAFTPCRELAPAPQFTVPQDVDQARLSVRVSVASASRCHGRANSAVVGRARRVGVVSSRAGGAAAGAARRRLEDGLAVSP